MKNKRIGMSRLTALILSVVMLLGVLSVSAVAAQSDGVLRIYKGHAEDVVPFYVENMFPGDRTSKSYTVEISYRGSITVWHEVRVRTGYEKLAEALELKVTLEGESQPLYEGYFKDMEPVGKTISALRGVTDKLTYNFEVWLDTSVGNDYQGLELIADFYWWADTEKPDNPDGFEPMPDDPVPIIPGPVEPVEPDDPDVPPVDPDDPDVPPVDPDDPDVPPVDPDDPDVPPVEPDDPDVPPVEPDDPDVPPEDPDDPGELIDPPKTGDTSNIFLWIVIAVLAVIIIILLLLRRKKDPEEKTVKEKMSRTSKSLMICIIVIVVLAVALSITTFALVRSIISVESHIFRTGTVEIVILNENKEEKPIISPEEFLFEPGMTVVKDFYVLNRSSDSVYYKVYFDNVSGELSEELDITIKDGDTVLYTGKAKDLEEDNVKVGTLLLAEEKKLTAVFHFPPVSGNEAQGMSLSFDLCAEATQTRHNPFKLFG